MFDYTEILSASALACAFFGICIFVIEGARKDLFRSGLPMALDFWLAAGLLRLSATTHWPAIAVAALVVIVRKMSNLALAMLGPRIRN